MKNKCYIFIITTLLFAASTLFSQPGNFGAWSYYKEISLNNTSNAESLTDYSVLVMVDTKTLITQGKMNADGSDIRFTTDFADDLEYWIEPGIQIEFGINEDDTHIWVKVPNITGASNSTLYMVYGNSTATGKSNIQTTFLFGDDFDDNSFDAARWETVITAQGQVNEQNKRLEHNSMPTNPESQTLVYSKQKFTGPVVLEMRFKKGGYVYRGAGLTGVTGISDNNRSWIGWQDWGQFGSSIIVSGTSASFDFRNDSWSAQYNPEYYLKIIRDKDSTHSFFTTIPAFEPDGYKHWENRFADAKMSLDTPLIIGLYELVWKNAGAPQVHYEDDIRVRKYSSPEPTTVVGSEFNINGNPTEVLPGEYKTDANTVLLLHMNETIGDTVKDASGQNNNGSATGTTIVDGRFGRARNFKGSSSDYITVPDNSSLNIIGPFTIEAWVKTSVATGNSQMIIGKRNENSPYTENYGLYHVFNGGVDFQFKDNSEILSVTKTDTNFINGKWKHIAGIYDGINLSLYINGALIDTKVKQSDPHISSAPITLSYPYNSFMYYFNGLIDEVRISNIARSPEEFNLQLPPKNLSATSEATAVNLTWENGGGAVPLMKYYIYRGDDSTAMSLFDSTLNTSYSNSGLATGTTYFYRVSALDSTGFEGAKSFAVEGTTATSTTPLLGEYTTDANTVLLLHMNEESGNDVSDASGQNNNGVASGTTVVDGRFGKARSYNGTNDRVLIGNPSSIANLTNKITIEGWFLPKAGSKGQHLISSGNENNFAIVLDENNKIRGGIHHNGIYTDTASNEEIILNRWYHVAISYNGSLLTLFINGVIQRSISITGNMNATSGNIVTLGAYSWFSGISEFFNGIIDEVRISNIARSPEEFNLQLPPKILTAVTSTSSVYLTWENGGGAVPLMKYYIYRGTDSTTMSLIDSTFETSFGDSRLPGGATYCYRISAVDSTGFEGAKSFAVERTVVDRLAQGLVAYYPFNDNANDESGNGNDGAISGATTTTDRFGTMGKAYSFDGTSSRIEIPNSLSLNPTTGITLSAWVKVNASTGDHQVVIGKWYNAVEMADPSYLLEFQPNGNIIQMPINGVTTDTYSDASSSEPISFNEWHFVAGTYGDATVNIYVDGVVKCKIERSGNIPSTNTPLIIGAHNSTGDRNPFNGMIDDIRIYNRALSENEIDSLYHAGGWLVNTVPAIPRNLTASVGNAQVVLRWNKNTETDFLKYRIYMGTTPTSLLLKDSSSASITDTTKIITGLINGTTYYFSVTALDSARFESLQSTGVSATPSANSTPNISLSTNSFAFGSVAPGSSVKRTLIIANTGTAALTGTVSVTANAGFSIDRISLNIFAGSSDSIHITFSPTAAQNYNATLTITHNATGSPSTVSLSGTGQIISGGANISLSRSGILVVRNGNFTSTTLATVIISNNGNLNLTGTAQFSGSSELSITGTSLNVPSLGTHTITLLINSTSIANGIYNGSITITHNAPDGTTLIPVVVKKFNVPSSIPLSKKIFFDNSIDPTSYQLFGLPGTTTPPPTSLFTGNYKEQWRMYRDNGGVTNYLEEYDGSSNFNFGPGKGFWILSSKELSVSYSSPNYTSNTGAYPIALQNGWNIISNPFERSVQWDDIKTFNNLPSNAFLYSWYRGVWSLVATVVPYTAYYYNNTGNAPSLLVPYDPNGSLGKQTIAKEYVPLNEECIAISISSNGEMISTAYVGFDSTSGNDFDNNDYFAPPSSFAASNIAIENTSLSTIQKRLFIEHRKEIGEGEEFDLVVKNISHDQTMLQFDGFEKFSSSNVFLFDEQRKIAFNLAQTGTISISQSNNEQRYRLLIGSNSFVKEVQTKVLPNEFKLYQNYPNPFNPSTTISYFLPSSSPVKVLVYDMLGREVQTIVNGFQQNGYYTFPFDARNLSSGVYYCRLHAGDFVSTVRMLLVK